MIDFRLSSTDSKNLEGYIAKLRKKGFKVEKKTFEQESKVTKGRIIKNSFYVISIENRAFQKKFQPNGGVWRRLPIFLDKKSLY